MTSAERVAAARRHAWRSRDFRHDVVCLLPARNAEALLPDWLESVGRFAGAVVALDDGSTDSTAKLLADHPLVKVLLRNPRRETYHGWDDAENRNRLLVAAAELHPRWILSLDADERIPAADAAALRTFLRDEALPDTAYGLWVHRMVEDRDTWDLRFPVYRFFAYRPGQRMPATRLHLVPVPTDIPRTNWIETTLRIRHLASLTERDRRARYEKYREADPDRRYQRSYENLLRPPSDPRPWEARPPGQPVVEDAEAHAQVAERILRRPSPLPALDPRRPVLSAIVISQNDRDRIEPVMDALTGQKVDGRVELILVNSGSDGTAELVRQRYPRVRVVHLSEPVLPGKARNAGLAFARGDYVSFPGSHVVLPPGSLQKRIEAHRMGFAMVTGTALNGTRTLSGWASYFLDHADALPGRPSYKMWSPPSHCSYLREPLIELGGFPENRRTGEDTLVNQALFDAGFRAWRSAAIRFVHRSPCRNPRRLVRHHFRRGQGYGRIVGERGIGTDHARARPATARELVRHPWRRLRYAARHVLRWGSRRQRLAFALCLPLIALGALASTLGTLHGLRRARRGCGVR